MTACESKGRLTENINTLQEMIENTYCKAFQTATIPIKTKSEIKEYPVEIRQPIKLARCSCHLRDKVCAKTTELFKCTPAVVTYFMRQTEKQKESAEVNKQTQVDCTEFLQGKLKQITKPEDCKTTVTFSTKDVKLNKKQLVRQKVIVKPIIKQD